MPRHYTLIKLTTPLRHICARRLHTRIDAAVPPMPCYYSHAYTVPLPPGHTFPMARYSTTFHTLCSRLQPLAASSHLHADSDVIRVHDSPPASDADLATAHSDAYVRDFFNCTLSPAAVREIGFPLTPAFHTRTRVITGGTIAAFYDVMRNNGANTMAAAPALGIAGNLAGGTHHAFYDRGEGYCIFNDIAVAARLALRASERDPARAAAACEQHRVLVIDLDVHQGNGTASIFQSDERVFTFSMHAHKNYPWRTRVASDFDVDLPDKTNDAQYMDALRDALRELERRLMSSTRRRSGVTAAVPQHDVWARVQQARARCDVSLVIYQAGVDPHGDDRLGRLALTDAGLRARNEAVFDFCDALQVPVVVTMGGGYARDIAVSARAHADVFMQAAAAWKRRAQQLHAAFGQAAPS